MLEQRFAIIEDGVVTNVITAKDDFVPAKGMAIQSDTANIGDKHDGKFQYHHLPEMAIDDLIVYTQQIGEEFIGQGTTIIIDGNLIEINKSNYIELLSIIQYVQINPSAQVTFENVKLSSAQVIKLFLGFFDYKENIRKIVDKKIKDIKKKKITGHRDILENDWPEKLRRRR